MHEQGGGEHCQPARLGAGQAGAYAPGTSNSGLLTLVLMAYEFFHKERNLSHADVAQPAFQKWLREFERAVARPDGTLTSSTGTLMKEMVLRGPSQYDCVIIYENLAIEYLDAATGSLGRASCRLSRSQHLERAPLLHSRRALERLTPAERGQRIPQVSHERADTETRPR